MVKKEAGVVGVKAVGMEMEVVGMIFRVVMTIERTIVEILM